MISIGVTASIFADDASAMVGKGSSFTALVKLENLAIEITHCCLHRKALMIKVLQELSKTMNNCIHICQLH